MKKNLFFLLLGLFIIYTQIHSSLFIQNNNSSKGDRLSNELVSKTGKKLCKKYNMSIGGLGGAEKDGIWLISVIFQQIGDPKDIPTARRILVDCVEEFLADINADEELRPYLNVFPFTSANLDIAIIFSSPTGDFVDPDLEITSEYKGEISYRTRDPEDHYKYKSVTEETYEEALTIVKNEKMVNQSTQSK